MELGLLLEPDFVSELSSFGGDRGCDAGEGTFELDGRLVVDHICLEYMFREPLPESVFPCIESVLPSFSGDISRFMDSDVRNAEFGTCTVFGSEIYRSFRFNENEVEQSVRSSKLVYLPVKTSPEAQGFDVSCEDSSWGEQVLSCLDAVDY